MLRMRATTTCRGSSTSTSRWCAHRLKVSPSSLTGATARIVETVPIGRRIDTGSSDDRSRLGEAIHACIAADLATPLRPLDMTEVAAILKRMQAADDVGAAALHHQLGALRSWLATRWPDAIPVVELPVARGYVRRAACARPDRSCLAHGHRLDPDGSQVHAPGAGPVGRPGHHVCRTARGVSRRTSSSQRIARGGDVAHLAGRGSGVAG
jgi:hypothetical protein